MRLACLLAGLAAVLLASGCAKQSPHIKFGEHFTKPQVDGQVPVQHYVSFLDAKGVPVGGLDSENFKVSVGGRSVVPTVQPSSTRRHDHLGLALVVDQGDPKKWEVVRDISEAVLMESTLNKDKAAIMTANGQWVEYKFDDPTKVRGVLRSLKSKEVRADGTFAAIDEIKNSGRTGLDPKSKLGIVAVIAGKPSSGQLPTVEPGVPLVIIDASNSNDPALVELAQKYGGLYIPVTGNNSITIAKNAMLHIKRELADLYVLGFRVSPRELPLRYSLTFTSGQINASADFIDDAWAMQLAVIAGIAAAILAIVILVFVRRRRNAAAAVVPVASGSGWSSGEYTIAGGQMGSADDDATTAGISPGSFADQQRQSMAFAGGAGDSTSADYLGGPMPPSGPGSTAGFGGGGGINYGSAGDVTSGALSADEVTRGSYAANDPTIGEMPAFGGPAGFTSAPAARLVLRFESGLANGQEVTVTSSVQIGRGDFLMVRDGEFVIPGDPKISRKHAQIRLDGMGGQSSWTIVHMSTTNKTYVNEQSVDSSRPLYANDRVRVGDTVFRVVDTPGDMGDSTLR